MTDLICDLAGVSGPLRSLAQILREEECLPPHYVSDHAQKLQTEEDMCLLVRRGILEPRHVIVALALRFDFDHLLKTCLSSLCLAESDALDILVAHPDLTRYALKHYFCSRPSMVEALRHHPKALDILDNFISILEDDTRETHDAIENEHIYENATQMIAAWVDAQYASVIEGRSVNVRSRLEKLNKMSTEARVEASSLLALEKSVCSFLHLDPGHWKMCDDLEPIKVEKISI